MKWILVLVGIVNGGPEATFEGAYNTMNDCFVARQETIFEYFGSTNGYPPTNFQVLCIPTDKY